VKNGGVTLLEGGGACGCEFIPLHLSPRARYVSLLLSFFGTHIEPRIKTEKKQKRNRRQLCPYVPSAMLGFVVTAVLGPSGEGHCED
jgi:hypothetical protein